jgi:hypothetical protein
MSRFVEFPMEDGSSVVVEVDDTGSRGGTLRGERTTEVVDKVNTTFEQALARVQPAAEAIITTMRGLAATPDEVAVEFGLKLSAAAGAVIASAATEANFTLHLTWKRADSAALTARAGTSQRAPHPDVGAP